MLMIGNIAKQHIDTIQCFCEIEFLRLSIMHDSNKVLQYHSFHDCVRLIYSFGKESP